jgi:hypothetical protein
MMMLVAWQLSGLMKYGCRDFFVYVCMCGRLSNTVCLLNSSLDFSSMSLLNVLLAFFSENRDRSY